MAEVIGHENSFEYVDSNFKSHQFSKNIFGTDIQFSVLKMEQSIFIWIGFQAQKCFSDLNLAIQSKFGKAPLSSHLLGDSSDIVSKALTSKISKKLGKAVFLSYNISDNQFTPEIIKCLLEEIDNNPCNF